MPITHAASTMAPPAVRSIEPAIASPAAMPTAAMSMGSFARSKGSAPFT